MRAAAKAVVCSAGCTSAVKLRRTLVAKPSCSFLHLGPTSVGCQTPVYVCECVDIYISAGWRIFLGLFSAELGVARPGAEVSIVCLFTWREKERLVDGDCDRI